MHRFMFLLIALALVLTACRTNLPTPTQPQPAAYLLASGERQYDQSLTLLDPATWTARRTVALPQSSTHEFSRDPQGRLWIGFSRVPTMLDNRVQIYSPEGVMLRELRPCTAPAAGISFAAGRAFVACVQNGFSGQIAVIDLGTLQVVRTIDLSLPDAALILSTSAANEQAVVVVGVVADPAKPSQNLITIIDPHTLMIRAQLNAGANTDIWRILPYGGRFYLLNSASWRQPRTEANDLLVLDTAGAPRLNTLALAPSPVWGAIDGDTLYTYHNPAWDQANHDETRLIARLDLKTGATQTWKLPPQWFASDLTFHDGQLLLTHQDAEPKQDGVYTFDPSTAALQRAFGNARPIQLLTPANI